MTETLTIRLGTAQRKTLRARAATEGKTDSDVVCKFIDVPLRAKRTTAAVVAEAMHFLTELPGGAETLVRFLDDAQVDLRDGCGPRPLPPPRGS